MKEEVFEPRIVKEKYSQTLAKGSKDRFHYSVWERKFSKTQLNSKYSKDSWVFIGKNSVNGSMNGQLLRGDIKGRGFFFF